MNVTFGEGEHMRVAVFACAIAVVATTTPASTASVPGPDTYRCQVMAFSPDPATAATGMCVTLDYHLGTANPDGNASAYLTKDGGRTWHRKRSDGLRPVLSFALKQLVFSAAYGSDHAIYLHAFGRGLLRSTDDGDTWLPLSPATDSSKTSRLLTPLPSAPVVQGGPALGALAFAGDPPALVTPPAHVPVGGAPGFEMQFLSDGASTFVASLDSDVSDGQPVGRTRLYACDPGLTCVRRLHEFPAGQDWQDGWLAPDFASSGRVYAITKDDVGQAYAWRSVDHGRSFARWASLDAFLRPIVNTNGTTVSIAGRRGSRTLFAHVSHTPFPRNGPLQPSPPAPPAQQILRSDDAGATWRRVAYGLSSAQRGRPGSLPWNRAVANTTEFAMLPDGRLVVMAASFPTYFGAFTSMDGRRWTRGRFIP